MFLYCVSWRPCGRNSCMIWVHHFHQHNLIWLVFFSPPPEDESYWEPHWRDRRASVGSAKGRSYRHYQRLTGISVLIHHWAEMWIIHQHVCGFILSERPRAWRRVEFGCWEGKNNNKNWKLAGNYGEVVELVLVKNFFEHPLCLIRLATCKGTAPVFFFFEIESGGRLQLNSRK